MPNNEIFVRKELLDTKKQIDDLLTRKEEIKQSHMDMIQITFEYDVDNCNDDCKFEVKDSHKEDHARNQSLRAMFAESKAEIQANQSFRKDEINKLENGLGERDFATVNRQLAQSKQELAGLQDEFAQIVKTVKESANERLAELFDENPKENMMAGLGM